jgi:elongation factor P
MITLTIERTYREGETFEPALEERAMQYLYKEGTHYHFMDNQTYEQIIIDEEALGDSKNYLKENLTVEILMFGDRAIGVDLPNFVNLRVIQTETWLKGDTSRSDYVATLGPGIPFVFPVRSRES